MYFVKIRESMMIAHSLKHPFFGPAQNVHGATFVVDVTFKTTNLDKHNVVIDIGLAHKVVKDILSKLDYQNLDDLDIFKGKLTTTEFIARYVYDEVSLKVKSYFEGKIGVSIKENPNAWAGFEEN
ncbi:6-carboxytetrahydropterin synthase [uncultured Flavobacterium sp.]|uniref:6-pyruvoyl trahydropterin synthase family protein n=1 Tax=uncultured Flavobacterium sp. TaxID=165435 RepID=UPI002930466E|nr:6-carboxytetrahydropterin synthase [uncultured Flavobacterium sp.]